MFFAETPQLDALHLFRSLAPILLVANRNNLVYTGEWKRMGLKIKASFFYRISLGTMGANTISAHHYEKQPVCPADAG